MIFFDLGPWLKVALVLCFLGSAAALTVLLYNSPVTLLIYLFIGQPLLLLGLVLYLANVWKDLVRHKVFQGRQKRS